MPKRESKHNGNGALHKRKQGLILNPECTNASCKELCFQTTNVLSAHSKLSFDLLKRPVLANALLDDAKLLFCGHCRPVQISFLHVSIVASGVELSTGAGRRSG